MKKPFVLKLKSALLLPLIILIIGTLSALAFNGYVRTQEAAQTVTLTNLHHNLNHSKSYLAEELDHLKTSLEILSDLIATQSSRSASEELVEKLNEISEKLGQPLFLNFPDQSFIEIQHSPQKMTIYSNSEGQVYKSYFTENNEKLANTELGKDEAFSDQVKKPNWQSLFEGIPANSFKIDYLDRTWLHYHLMEDGFHFMLSTHVDNTTISGQFQDQLEGEPHARIYLTENDQLIIQTQGHNQLSQKEFDAMIVDPDIVTLTHPFPLDYANNWKMHLSIPKFRMAESINRNLMDTLVQTLLVLLGIMLFIFVITYRIASPLQRLKDKADKLMRHRFDELKYENHVIEEYRHIEEALHALRKRYQSINKYVPTTLIDKLEQSNFDMSIKGESKPLYLMDININDFTHLSKGLTPQQLVHFLSLYQTALYDILTEKKAVVGQNNGAHILAYWGAPVANDNDSLLSCQAALEISHALDKLNSQLVEDNYPTFEFRITVYSGDTVVGNFGSSKRMKYSVIGGTVDNVQIVNRLNKQYGTRVLICSRTYQEVKGSYYLRKIDRVEVTSREKPEDIYELICHKNDPLVKQKVALVTEYEAALDTLNIKDYDKAEDAFMALMSKHPEDEASVYQAGKVFQLKQNQNYKNTI